MPKGLSLICGRLHQIINGFTQGSQHFSMKCQGVELVASALLGRNRLSLHEDAMNHRLRSLFSCARLVRTRFRVRHHKMPLSDGEAFHMGTDLTFRKVTREIWRISCVVLARTDFGEDGSVGSIGHAESCFE